MSGQRGPQGPQEEREAPAEGQPGRQEPHGEREAPAEEQPGRQGRQGPHEEREAPAEGQRQARAEEHREARAEEHRAARAEELSKARAAEAAAASDFTPLRVRPYVSLPDSEEPGTRPGVVAQPLPPLADPAASEASAVTDTIALRVPALAARAGRRPGRDRRFVALAVLGGVAGVAAIALLTSALLDGGSQDEALPETSPSAAVTLGPPPSPSASTSSPAPSPKSPGPSRSTAAPAAPAPRPEPTVGRDLNRPKAPSNPELRRGSSGPEVAELQRRLQQAFVYAGHADGEYDVHVENAVRGYQFTRGVQGDPKGVYGAATRKSLEASTRG
ncbi:peptidoglycan-binding protein [Streptomyces sp. NA04227]|uniref:peptidoglycan-binding domain-containing protein n=1 Tax=Streptomyces sp. NA04227 TaxID=2742136 RepID=UPI0015906CDF|nr:peptidoglycan-binding domain-containing protein [Streptomyces sp. NA04227]QKW06262.1 peptidoglycan-binding protein [Streptomyces sp. NA04227]